MIGPSFHAADKTRWVDVTSAVHELLNAEFTGRVPESEIDSQ